MTRCAGSMLLTYADMSFTQFCTEHFLRQHLVMPAVHADLSIGHTDHPKLRGVNSSSHEKQDTPSAADLDTEPMA